MELSSRSLLVHATWGMKREWRRGRAARIRLESQLRDVQLRSSQVLAVICDCAMAREWRASAAGPCLAGRGARGRQGEGVVSRWGATAPALSPSPSPRFNHPQGLS